jgi:hypothetical protein
VRTDKRYLDFTVLLPETSADIGWHFELDHIMVFTREHTYCRWRTNLEFLQVIEPKNAGGSGARELPISGRFKIVALP